MNRLFSLFNKKAFAVFFFTLLIGLWAGGLFERYVFNFAFVQNFSIREAQRLNGKIVREMCYERQTQKEKIGRVIGYSGNNYALVRIRVRWENDRNSFYTEYPKSYFSKCIEVTD